MFTEFNIFAELHEFSELTGAFTRGDYVDCGIVGIQILKDFGVPWYLRYVLDFIVLELKMIHPIYNTIFPSTKNKGSLKANVGSGFKNVGSGLKTLKTAENVLKFFG